MAEFILMVVLMQPSPLEETRWLVVGSFSVAGFSENGCKNAQRVISEMGKVGRFGVMSICLPKHVAKLEVEPPAK